MKLKEQLVEKVKELGFNINSCKNINDLCKLLPGNYIFIEQKLWVGRLFVDADNYDYPNAVLSMLILLSRQIKDTKIYAVFCGSGKTWICENTNVNAVEIEYWKYKEKGYNDKYIEDVKKRIGVVDYLFVSTDPEGISLLLNEGLSITIVYPKNELRNEYLDRYIERDSPYDFIGTFMKHWHIWINELKSINICPHIVLESGQYLHSVITQ